MDAQVSDSGFITRIAFFNSVGIAHAVLVPTIVDPLLKTHRLFPERQGYPMGYWILLIVPVVFILTLLFMRCARGVRGKCLSSFLPLCLAGLLVLPNFRPEWFHGNVLCWVFLYSIVAVIATWLHFTPVESDYLSDTSLPFEGRLERLKDSISFWRSAGTSLAVAYLALIVSWIAFIWIAFPQMIVTDRGEQIFVGLSGSVQVSAFSVYVLCAPIIETIKKSRNLAVKLTQIPKT